MASQDRIGGIIEIAVDGETLEVSAEGVEWSLGEPNRKTVIGGHGRAVGYVDESQVPMVKGTCHVTVRTKLRELLKKENASVVLKLPWGQSVIYRGAWMVSDGVVKTDESKMAFQFDARDADLL
jgi:hypothetical protein